MSKRNYVCFDCRMSVRSEPYFREEVPCPQCGKACQNIGYKTPVPPKGKLKEWHTLRDQIDTEKRSLLLDRQKTSLRRKHDLEQEIKKLESLPVNPGRQSLLKKLCRELESINAEPSRSANPANGGTAEREPSE